MEFNSIRPDLIKYEARVVQGADPREVARKRPGAFARFMSGIGKVAGAVMAPLSFIFPPLAIGAAASYGVGAIGDQAVARANQKEFENFQRENATMVAYPGVDFSKSASGLHPANFAELQQQQPGMTEEDAAVMSVLFARGTMSIQNAHQIEGGE